MASRFESVCDSRLLGLLLCYGAVELVVHHFPLWMLPLHPVADGICLPPCTGMSETAPPDRDVAVPVELLDYLLPHLLSGPVVFRRQGVQAVDRCGFSPVPNDEVLEPLPLLNR